MPAYTHLRRAQPVLVAHFLLAHAAALRRDHARFGGGRAEADALPLGSGAVAGTNYAIDTRALAARSASRASSRTASTRRRIATSSSAFLHACALTMVHLSRFAEDMMIFSGEEYGFFELSDAASTGSSMMPQKKNPDPLELVRGKTGRAIGHLAGWLATMKGLPSGYNKDLQEDKEAVFDAEATLAGSLEAVAIVVEGLTVNADRAERGRGRAAARHRRRRLSGRQGPAVPPRARTGRRDDAAAAGRRPGFRVAAAGRVARLLASFSMPMSSIG